MKLAFLVSLPGFEAGLEGARWVPCGDPRSPPSEGQQGAPLTAQLRILAWVVIVEAAFRIAGFFLMKGLFTFPGCISLDLHGNNDSRSACKES